MVAAIDCDRSDGPTCPCDAYDTMTFSGWEPPDPWQPKQSPTFVYDMMYYGNYTAVFPAPEANTYIISATDNARTERDDVPVDCADCSAPDVCEKVVVAAVDVDIDTDSNNDGTIGETDDPIEMDSPGRIIECGQTTGLAEIKLAYEPVGADEIKDCLLQLSFGSKVRIWSSPSRTGEITNGKWYRIGTDTIPTSLYVEAGSPGETTISWTFLTPSWGTVWSDTVKVTVLQVTYANPHGDPANVTTAQDGANEFTYDSGTPGICRVSCVATLNPDNDATRAWAEQQIAWSIDSIAGSTLTWVNSDGSGGYTSGDNKGAEVYAQFEGLPTSNGAFGRKNVTMSVQAFGINEQKQIEVFFDKYATNHPGGEAGSPNWYHYWKDAHGGMTNTVYEAECAHNPPCSDPSLSNAEVRGMAHWSYLEQPDKSTIYMHNGSETFFHYDVAPPAGVGPFSGIDLFYNIYLHESKHRQQIAAFDGCVPVSSGGPWQYGWSFNQGSAHNHWNVGPDGKPGAPNVDDDGDGTVDNLITGGPGELRLGYDEALYWYDNQGHININWPMAYASLPPKPWAGGGSAVEHEAFVAMTIANNTNTVKDWGNPGKQHASGDYDD